MATVSFKNVSKKYGEDQVLEDVNLEIGDEEFMVLVGPSGCGKTTALRMVAGLEAISHGTISIGGRVVNDLPPKDRDIAMVFQNYALYPHMTIRENLEFGLRMRKAPRAEIDRLVAAAAEILEMTSMLDRRPRQVSGGQRQRVAIGRAIVRQPAVFLFDEPLSNLDAKLRVQMRAEIKKLQQRLKTTTLYVTHDQIEAMTMGSRIAVMKDGRIQQVGAPLEIYQRPENLFVANFIGAPPMNLLPARLTKGGESLEISRFSLPVSGALGAVTRGREGERVIVGIRPENLLGPRQKAAGETASVPVIIELVQPLGDEVIVYGRIGENVLVSKLDPRHVPVVGDPLELAVELDKIHLFDAKSERRLVA